jgi:hypothetical protein
VAVVGFIAPACGNSRINDSLFRNHPKRTSSDSVTTKPAATLENLRSHSGSAIVKNALFITATLISLT